MLSKHFTIFMNAVIKTILLRALQYANEFIPVTIDLVIRTSR